MPETRKILGLKEQQIRDNLRELYRLSRNALERATGCIETVDSASARDILGGDSRINEMRRLLEQDCLIAIASQSSVNRDLRDAVAVMRIAADLERIGDYSADIAAVVGKIDAGHLDAMEMEKLRRMSDICLEMLDSSWRAYDERNGEQALNVSEMGGEIDKIQRELIDRFTARMKQNPASVDSCSRLLWVSHCLELCSDRISNIAGQVLFITVDALMA